MKALVLVLASIFIATVVFSQPDASEGSKLKVLTWNIYMLPHFLGYEQVSRAQEIGELLSKSDYDVIVFQEAFHQKARKRISRLLQPAFPFNATTDPYKFSFRTGSGLWIFSKHPIQAVHSIVFKTCHGIDALSRKGALLVELKVGNAAIQVIGTHLQNSGDEWRRVGQCHELYKGLIKKYEHVGVPQVICGDFNINKDVEGSKYQLMLETLDAIDGEVVGEQKYSYDRQKNDLTETKGLNRDLIDYVLTRSNSAWLTCANRKIMMFRTHWNNDHRDLSDHFSLEATIHFRHLVAIIATSNP